MNYSEVTKNHEAQVEPLGRLGVNGRDNNPKFLVDVS